MNYVKGIRLELGLTQAALADILCISRANISLVEADMRKLSSDNIVKLRKLKMHSLQIQAEEMDGMEALVQSRKMELIRHLETQIEQTEAKLAKAEKWIESMSKKYHGSCEALKLIRKELEIFAGVEDYEKRLNVQFNIQKKIYLDNHPSARYLHELNISEFKSTLELYRQQLAQQIVQ
jgi:transcriptional regulator with XRE-family HTH domain